MKAFWAFLLIALAGCSSSHPLDSYLMLEGDAPDACYFIDPSDPEWNDYTSIAGFEENPGPVNAFYLTVDGIRPVENRFAVIECKFGDGYYQYASGVQRFASESDAQAWAEAVQEQGSVFTGGAQCAPQAFVFTEGDIIGAIGTFSSEWHPEFRQHAEETFEEILDETGARDYC